MTKRVLDEFVEHHEGQAIFTTRRVVFGSLLIGVALAVGIWFLITEPA